ncbi:Mdm36p Ecym_3440 [Eremothecium cymbalariae DBVPG|uniref:Uncharacterized protein n=1 Tax=Eremothecium cymbalariae (strain CBS 270.75 / DBVPG 7215 / KCTC 17166 / NRRL Y-17582) TaxID=931890 RepID=G8JS06_ERECY|nr:Hypothetical protein Ecym_3440 [Eremothecium cymbalariae DBVPG\
MATMDYKDPILSHFQDKKVVNVSKLSQLIDAQKGLDYKEKGKGESMGNGGGEEVFRQCETTLSLYTDLIKLKVILKKTWDLQTLDKSVMVRFGIQAINATCEPRDIINSTEEFYKDIAFKTIAKCDRISKALEQLTADSDDTLRVIKDVMKGQIRQCYMQDSLCLLLEMWFLCGNVLRELKRNVASFFMKAKLLLIDYELECIQFSITGDDSQKEQYHALSDTLKSYKSFIQVLLQQLQDAESTSDQSLFEDCLGVFLDVESMYQSLNMSWLLNENRLLKEDMDEYEKGQFELEERYHAEKAGQLVDQIVNNDMFEETSISSSTQLDSSEVTAVPSVDDKKASVVDNLAPPMVAIRSSEHSELSVNMEDTSISKELPNLLKAFNNAKRLEMEIESVRMSPEANTPLGTPGSPVLSESMMNYSTPNLRKPSISGTFSTSTSPGLSPYGNSTLNAPTSQLDALSGSSIMVNAPKLNNKSPNLTSSSILENLVHKSQHCNNLENTTATTKIREEMLKVMLSNNALKYANQQKHIHGFGSNVLNNLYGIGSRK